MPDSFECQECGEEFDTERGLNIHKGQKHAEEEEKDNTEDSQPEQEPDNPEDNEVETHDSVENQEEDTTENEEPEESGILNPQSITISAYNAVLGAFFMGLVFGVSLSMVATGFNFSFDLSESNDPLLVELENTDYPFGDVEAGVGDSNQVIGNSTYQLQGEPYIGSSDAPVKMVAWEDFQCPFCGKFHSQSFPQILENYISTGDVQFYYKDFPLRIHPWADDAGIAAQCALNQDAEVYWTFNKGFYDNQEALKNTFEQNQTMFDKSMYRWAEQTGLDTETFNQCYDNRETENEVRSDLQDGSQKGISATPGFLINDQMLEGAQPYQIFESRIEEALQN